MTEKRLLLCLYKSCVVYVPIELISMFILQSTIHFSILLIFFTYFPLSALELNNAHKL